MLPAVAADALAEVRFPVEQADRDQRQPEIGRALEVVARQHAEAARIDRAAIRGCRTPPKNRRPGGRAAGRRGPSPGPRRAQVVAQLAVGAVDAGAQRGVARQDVEAFG